MVKDKRSGNMAAPDSRAAPAMKATRRYFGSVSLARTPGPSRGESSRVRRMFSVYFSRSSLASLSTCRFSCRLRLECRSRCLGLRSSHVSFILMLSSVDAASLVAFCRLLVQLARPVAITAYPHSVWNTEACVLLLVVESTHTLVQINLALRRVFLPPGQSLVGTPLWFSFPCTPAVTALPLPTPSHPQPP